MANSLITNDGLKKFIDRVNISQERKDFLLSKLPEMDLEERLSLLNLLKEVYLLDLEEEEVLARLRKFGH